MNEVTLTLIEGGQHEDARGALRFCNGFDMSSVKRFYTISNSVKYPKRGWIMHKRETKWFFPLRGTTVIHVEPENWNASSVASATRTFTLSASSPMVLQVPPSHWFLIEQNTKAEVQVFSNCLVNEFPNDDIRRSIGQTNNQPVEP